MRFHRFANLYPLMDGDEFDSLCKSIDENGLRNPIVVHHGQILDGRNRYNACVKLGIEPDFDTYFGDQSAYGLLSFVRDQNENRRHLSSGQRAAIAVMATELVQSLAQDAHERKRHPKLIYDDSKGEVIDQLAEMFNTNRQYVHKAKQLKEEAPELLDKVISGEIKMPKAIRELKRRQVIKDLDNKMRKQAKEVEGVYDVIVIDPPWPIQKIERDVAPNQVGMDYPVMEVDEIAGMYSSGKVPFDENCHIWLWTTQKYLPSAFNIFKAWDVKYICTFVWHKPGGFQPFSLPQYNCEFALYGRKGNPEFIDLKDFKVCFDAPRGKHSEKPREFYDMIRRVTAGRRLDMFSRRKIDGFDSWGKEALDAGPK